jgi:hypothetical protein
MRHEEYYEEEYYEEEEYEERDERCIYEQRWWDYSYYEDARWM